VNWREGGAGAAGCGSRCTVVVENPAGVGGARCAVQSQRGRRTIETIAGWRSIRACDCSRLPVPKRRPCKCGTCPIGSKSSRWSGRSHCPNKRRSRFVLDDGRSGVGNLRLPSIEVQRLRTGNRWLGLSVDPSLEYYTPRRVTDRRFIGRRGEAETEAIAAGDFLKLWGTAASLAPSQPIASTPLPIGVSPPNPRSPLTTAEPALAVSFDRERIEFEFAAQLTTGVRQRFPVSAARSERTLRAKHIVEKGWRGKWPAAGRRIPTRNHGLSDRPR